MEDFLMKKTYVKKGSKKYEEKSTQNTTYGESLKTKFSI